MRIEFGGKLIKCTFIRRISRFSALVEIDATSELVYLPNSGRMKELLQQGSEVVIREQLEAGRKTRYDLIGVYLDREFISVDSRIPNRLLEKAWDEDGLEAFKGIVDYRREVTVGKSKLDFLLKYHRTNCYVEAKSVTLVEDQVAKFPDAPTERGSKHLLELIDLVEAGNRAAVIFVIQRKDAESFRPNSITDPEFAKNLEKALNCGVEIYAFTCDVDERQISFRQSIRIDL